MSLVIVLSINKKLNQEKENIAKPPMRSVCGLSLTTACKIIAGLWLLSSIAAFVLGGLAFAGAADITSTQAALALDIVGAIFIISGILVIVRAILLYKGVEQRKDGLLIATLVFIGLDICHCFWMMKQKQYAFGVRL